MNQILSRAVVLRAITLLAMCLGLLSASAQQERSEDRDTTDKVHVDNADVFNGEEISGHTYQFLKGNVELSQDSVYMYCDSAMIIDQREVRAFGNVIIQKGDSVQVYADTLLYFADTRLADLHGQVALIHGDQQIWTTHLSYDMNLNVAHYDEPAQLLEGTTQLSSLRGIYWVDSEVALFIDSVEVIDPEFSMITDSLRYDAASELARFIAPTYIFQEGGQIYCESGFYSFREKKAEFRGNPEYRNGDQVARAEVIRYDREKKEVMLIGDASFTEKEREAEADSILYYEDTGDTRLIGNAMFRDETRFVQSENEINYNRITESISTRGRSTLTEGSQILEADSIDFDQQTGVGFIRGSVHMRDTASQIELISEKAEYRKENGYMKAYGTTRPLLKSVVDADTMYVTADSLITFDVQDTVAGDTVRYMQGYKDVRIFRGTMQGLCDSIVFNGRDSVFVMYGDPVLWSDTTQFTADTIELYLKNSALSRVVLLSNGLIISSIQKIFYNQIRGKRVDARVVENQIQDMQVTGNAESIYYAQDDEQAFLGVNRVASSEIFFLFQESKIDQIRFITKPSGVMTPMHQADHETMRLEGFVWREEVRPKDLTDLF